MGVARRPTIAAVARAAGVSVATVDRVINGRLPVSEATAKRVYEAAREIKYHAAGLIRRRIERAVPPRTLAFLLTKSSQHFYGVLAQALDEATRGAEEIHGTPMVEFSENATPQETADMIRRLGGKADALAVVAADHPAVTAAVAELNADGVPVFTLLSDLSTQLRAAYIGIDNRKAGRTAAWAIARMARSAGRVALFLGSHRYLGHELREIGFRSYFREHASQFELLDSQVNLDDANVAYEATLQLIRSHPTLVGIAVAGGGMEGVIRALREENVGDRLAVVCNEVTPESRAALADHIVSMVIATPIKLLARTAVAQMVRAFDPAAATRPDRTFLPFELAVPENIEDNEPPTAP
jgi:LacI family transcriptional regulator